LYCDISILRPKFDFARKKAQCEEAYHYKMYKERIEKCILCVLTMISSFLIRSEGVSPQNLNIFIKR